MSSPFKPKIYFFVLMDCEGTLHASDKRMPKVIVEIETFSDDGESYSHFSFEDQGMLRLHVWLLIIFGILFSLNVYSYI